mmetsp:Transcript_18360/g.29737  ORF Transcript_18360/g.29737 Transcript_18360/m.29737 type:complete len:279 (-) Transcript_18360:673-1509(-)
MIIILLVPLIRRKIQHGIQRSPLPTLIVIPIRYIHDTHDARPRPGQIGCQIRPVPSPRLIPILGRIPRERWRRIDSPHRLPPLLGRYMAILREIDRLPRVQKVRRVDARRQRPPRLHQVQPVIGTVVLVLPTFLHVHHLVLSQSDVLLLPDVDAVVLGLARPLHDHVLLLVRGLILQHFFDFLQCRVDVGCIDESGFSYDVVEVFGFDVGEIDVGDQGSTGVAIAFLVLFYPAVEDVEHGGLVHVHFLIAHDGRDGFGAEEYGPFCEQGRQWRFSQVF